MDYEEVKEEIKSEEEEEEPLVRNIFFIDARSIFIVFLYQDCEKVWDHQSLMITVLEVGTSENLKFWVTFVSLLFSHPGQAQQVS